VCFIVVLAIQVHKLSFNAAGIAAVVSGLNNHFIFFFIGVQRTEVSVSLFFALFADFDHRIVDCFFHQFHVFVRPADWVDE
jgi:hypothetical protein